jgi:hypothetical protein
MRRSLYKYFSEQSHAEAFLGGKILFRSLAYFRDNEDTVRGDEYEGTAKFLPEGGLVVHNQTRENTFVLPMAFESSVKAHEIYAYCVSRTLSRDLAQEFNAVACVEITKIAALCTRIERALPTTATFKGRRVEYYSQTQPGNPRWALPEKIATSKLDRWTSQDEYRFVFSLTDALAFEAVQLRLIDRNNRPAPKPEDHIEHLLDVGSLRDICILHDCKTL